MSDPPLHPIAALAIDEAAITLGKYIDSRFKAFQAAYDAAESDKQAAKKPTRGAKQSAGTSAHEARRKREQRTRFLEGVYHKLATGLPLPVDQQRTRPTVSLATLASQSAPR